jgi:deoxycytidylate deaminase
MISPKLKNLINKLIIQADKSKIEYKLAAGIIKTGKLIDLPKCNSVRNICHGFYSGSLHAEARAIINYFGKSIKYVKNKGWTLSNVNINKNNKLNLIVIRMDSTNNICNARPCYYCLDMMKSVGINKVYYSISNDEIICEKVKDMISIHTSSVARNIEIMKGNKYASCDLLFHSNLLYNSFPKYIRKNNLLYFIKYNLQSLHFLKVNINFNQVIIINEFDNSKLISYII